MNREHKFRAWVDGKMVYIKDDIAIEFYDAKMAVDWSIRSRVDGHSIYKHDSSYPDSYGLNKLMQYIGRKDKESKELYEDDICELTSEFQGYNAEGDGAFWHRFTGVIVFTPSLGYYLKIAKAFDLDNQEPVEVFARKKHIASYRIKRIGNKHENPELLKQTDNENGNKDSSHNTRL